MTISRCFNPIIIALLAAMASVSALAAAPPAVQLVAQKTTSTPAGNACPKSYTFTFRLRSNMDGPAQYHFVFSDGSQIAPQSIDLKKGQNFELSTTWTLSANMKGAWAGVQFGDGGPMHMSTFSMTCSGAAPGGTKTPGPVMTPIPGPVMTPGPIKTPVAVNQQKCPAGTRPATVVFNSNKKMEGCMKPESFLCGNGYREMTSVTGFSFCGSREALNPKSQKCPNEIFLDPSDKQQHCREADSDKCPAGFRMEKPVGENQFHCVTSGAAH